MKTQVHFVVNFALVSNNKILLERLNDTTSWKLPGGHVDDCEDPIEALNREAYEELGIKVNVINNNPLFNISDKAYSIPTPFEMFCHGVDKDGNLNEPHRNIGLVYLVESNQKPIPKENQELKWFDEKDIQNEDLLLPVKLLCLKALSIFQSNEE